MYVTDRAQLCVARTLPLPLSQAQEAASYLRAGHDPLRAVGLAIGGRIELQLPLRRDAWLWFGDTELTPLRTTAALYTPGNRRICRAEVELAAWSREMSELSLRPAVRAPHAWSGRRLRRWFTYAHAAADELRTDLLAVDARVRATLEELERVAV